MKKSRTREELDQVKGQTYVSSAITAVGVLIGAFAMLKLAHHQIVGIPG